MQVVFSAYTSKRNLDKFGRDDNDSESGYTEAFFRAYTKIDVDILHLKKAFDMGTLLTMYKTLLQRRNLPFETYRTEKLKRRLVNHYGDKIVFQVQFDGTKFNLIEQSQSSFTIATYWYQIPSMQLPVQRVALYRCSEGLP